MNQILKIGLWYINRTHKSTLYPKLSSQEVSKVIKYPHNFKEIEIPRGKSSKMIPQSSKIGKESE